MKSKDHKQKNFETAFVLLFPTLKNEKRPLWAWTDCWPEWAMIPDKFEVWKTHPNVRIRKAEIRVKGVLGRSFELDEEEATNLVLQIDSRWQDNQKNNKQEQRKVSATYQHKQVVGIGWDYQNTGKRKTDEAFAQLK